MNIVSCAKGNYEAEYINIKYDILLINFSCRNLRILSVFINLLNEEVIIR